MGRSEPPKTLSEVHRSLPQGNLAYISDIFDNPEKMNFSELLKFSTHGRRKWTSDSKFADQNTLASIK